MQTLGRTGSLGSIPSMNATFFSIFQYSLHLYKIELKITLKTWWKICATSVMPISCLNKLLFISLNCKPEKKASFSHGFVTLLT
jgi:hypothetical protein